MMRPEIHSEFSCFLQPCAPSFSAIKHVAFLHRAHTRPSCNPLSQLFSRLFSPFRHVFSSRQLSNLGLATISPYCTAHSTSQTPHFLPPSPSNGTSPKSYYHKHSGFSGPSPRRRPRIHASRKSILRHRHSRLFQPVVSSVDLSSAWQIFADLFYPFWSGHRAVTTLLSIAPVSKANTPLLAGPML